MTIELDEISKIGILFEKIFYSLFNCEKRSDREKRLVNRNEVSRENECPELETLTCSLIEAKTTLNSL